MEPQSTPTVLAIGVDQAVLSRLADILGSRCKLVRQSNNLDELLELDAVDPKLILCECPEGVPTTEFAQALRMIYLRQPMYLVCRSRQGFHRASMRKNGFTDIFALPIDWDVMRTEIALCLSRTSGLPCLAIRSVKLSDLSEGFVPGADLMALLPEVGKFMPIARAGQALEGPALTDLRKNGIHCLFAKADALPTICKQITEMPSKEPGEPFRCLTEARQQFIAGIREIVAEMLNDSVREVSFEQGRTLGQQCKDLVQRFVMARLGMDKAQLISSCMGEMHDFYGHCANVATYAALFSVMLEVGKPEELALAGMLHELGMIDVPLEIARKDPKARTLEEQRLYEGHVDASINILKKRRVILPEAVLTAISQQHERYDGKGFPAGIAGARMSPEGQILALADQFEYLTLLRTGQRPLSAREAMGKIQEQRGAYDRAWMKKLDESFRKWKIGET